MSLEFEARLDERGFDVTLSIAAGETVAVLGPNGAGKSTLLGILAGLIRPDAGRAVLGDATLFDLHAPSRRAPRRWLAPHERGVSLLAQEALLFPHLSALDNVAFGPRSSRGRGTHAGRRLGRAEADRIAAHWLDEVGAAEFADRTPAQLSGGQAQRIAVARALAAEPRLLLLDEPMAALDVAVAPALRRMLRRVLAGRTAVIVTHDILDAFMLADRVVVMDGGRIVDSGPTRAVLERPSNQFTAGLAGLNALIGTADASAATAGAATTSPAPGAPGAPAALGMVVVDGGLRLLAATDAPLTPGAPAAVAIRPSLVEVSTAADPAAQRVPHSTPTNVVPGTVLDLEPRGDVVRVRNELIAADLAPARVAALDLAPGTPIRCTFDATDALAYPL